MSTLPKKVLRQMIKENDIKSVEGIHSFLNELFKTSIQEMLEAELEVGLCPSKNDKKNKETDNARNGYSSMTVKS
jgi:transposase-like protein